jgi:hypothetical protein
MLLTLLACGGDVHLEMTTDYCDGVDPADPGDPQLRKSVSGDQARVWRSNVVRDADDVLDSAVAADAGEVTVHESWTPGNSGNDLCFQPTLLINGLTGSLDVAWYVDEESTEVAWQTITVEAE